MIIFAKSNKKSFNSISLHLLNKVIIMYYKFRRDWSYSTSCIVEADSLEEAKRLQVDAEWETDDGGEHYLDSKCIYVSESEDDIDNGKVIEDLNW